MLTRGRLASCAAVSTRFLVINRFYHGETIHTVRNMLHLRQTAIKKKRCSNDRSRHIFRAFRM